MSLPLRECGLKLPLTMQLIRLVRVTPLAGVWVEIYPDSEPGFTVCVTPLAGVWVEILTPPVLIMVTIRHSPCGSVG